jgi:predicted RNase H-like HicB family nuclease
MKKVKFIIEKSRTGYAAYAENFEKYPVTTTADTMEELKANMVDALNTWLEFKGLPLAEPGQIALKIDLPQFFEYYNELNAKAISKRAGISQTLLSDYVNGRKKPSEKQTKRILSGVQALGRELASLEFA